MEAGQGAAEFSENDYVGKSVAIKEHTATDDTQLSLEVGDVVFVLEKDETGWWGGHKAGEDTTGWFPGTALRSPLEPVVVAQPHLAASEPPRPLSPAGQWASPGGAQPDAPASPAPAAPPALREAPPGSSGGAVWVGGQLAAGGPAAGWAQATAPRRGQRAEGVGAPAGAPAAEPKHVPEGRCSPTPAGGEGSYLRGGRMVASPQGAEASRSPGASDPQGTQGPAAALAGGAGGGLDAEPVRLREEVARLRGELQQLRRQSSAEQSRIHELEQLLRSQEQQLKNQASLHGSAATEAAVLRDKLERERQNCEAQAMASDQMRQRYEERLREKSEDTRMDQEAAQRSIQAEQQRAQGERRRAEELERQLREAREELAALRRERPPAAAGVAGGAAEAAPGEQAPSAGLGGQGAARRGGAPTAAPAAAPAAVPAATEPLGAARGRPLPRAPEQQSPLQPRQLCHARSAGSLPAEEGPPRGLVLEKVSLFEERCRSQTPMSRSGASARGRSAAPGGSPAARPASRGPGRRAGPPAEESESWCSRAVAAAPTAAYLPSRPAPSTAREAPARVAGLRPLCLQALRCEADDDAGEGQPFMGMSPIHKESGAERALPPLAQLPSGAMSVPATWDRGTGEATPPGFSPAPREHSGALAAPGGPGLAEQVSVSEQVRRLQGGRAR